MSICTARNRILTSRVTMVLICCMTSIAFAASSISIPTQQEAQGVNERKIGVVFTHEELFHQLVHNMEDELEQESGLRIVPIMSKKHVQSVYDLLYLQGVDLALVRADAIEYVSRRGEYPAVKRLVQSVAKVSEEKIIVIARNDYQSLAELEGQVIGFGLPGSGEYVTGTVAFDVMGIEPDAIEVSNSTAIEKMKTGELAAMVYLLRAPDAVQTGGDLGAANAIKSLDLGDELHIMEIPANDELSKIYTPTTLTASDLPDLIDEGKTIATYSVDAILAVYRWTPPNFRFTQSQRFMSAFIAGLDGLQDGPYQPAWKRVDLQQQTRNITPSPLVSEALDARAIELARLAEEKRISSEQAATAAKAAKVAALLEKRDELTSRIGEELNQADTAELERMLKELGAFLEEL